MSKYVWSLNLTTHAANVIEAKKEVEAFLESHPTNFGMGRLGVSHTKYDYDGEHKLTSEKEFVLKEFKGKKRPKLCALNPKGVHEWSKRVNVKGWFCIHCDVQVKNRKETKEQPVRCLISGTHKYVTTDINKWEFKCLSCGDETSLMKIIKNIVIDKEKEKGAFINKWTVWPEVKCFLNNNGKPLGRSKITHKLVQQMFDTLYRRTDRRWVLK